jgi:hypothetical protein
MASTITAQSLTVTISEQIVLNNQQINSENQVTVPNINEIGKRIVSIPFDSQVTILNFGTAVAAGTYINANVKYIRITNKDNSNFVRIRVIKTAGQTFDVKVEPGQSFIMSNVKESANIGGSAFSAFVDADSISGQADTAAVDIEYFIASI